MSVSNLGSPQFIEVKNMLINICEIESVALVIYDRDYVKGKTIIPGGIALKMNNQEVHIIREAEEAEKVLKVLQYYKIRISE